MNPGFLLAEDAAIKARFSGITVSDDRKAQRPVKVFFRYPDGETEKEYPFITIEHLGISHARNLQHSEQDYFFNPSASSASVNSVTSLHYFPSELDRESLENEYANSAAFVRARSFIPVNLVYQIATYTRSALHDRQLTSKILRIIAPYRQSYILIPEDGTSRRLDMLSWANSDLLDQEAGYRKRIFRKVYTIQMNAELPSSELVEVPQASSVVGTINNSNNTDRNVPYSTVSEAF